MLPALGRLLKHMEKGEKLEMGKNDITKIISKGKKKARHGFFFFR